MYRLRFLNWAMKNGNVILEKMWKIILCNMVSQLYKRCNILQRNVIPFRMTCSQSLPGVFGHIEGCHSRAILGRPHFQQSPPRGLNNEEKGPPLHIRGPGHTRATAALHAHPTNQGVPVPYGRWKKIMKNWSWTSILFIHGLILCLLRLSK